MNIVHSDMVTKLAKPGAQILAEMTPEDAHLMHMTIGMAGEAGELLDAVESVVELWAQEAQFDMDNVNEELGDLEFYTEGLRQGLGIDYVFDRTFGNEVPYDLRDVTTPDRKLHLAVRISVVCSEILDLAKKRFIYRKELDTAKVISLLGNLEMFLFVFRESVGTNRGVTLTANIKKLSKRYENFVYSDQAAQNRADKADHGDSAVAYAATAAVLYPGQPVVEDCAPGSDSSSGSSDSGSCGE